MSYWKSPEDYVLSSSENNLLTTTGNFCGPRSLKLTKIFLVVSRKRILTATGVSDKLLPGVAAMLAGSDIAQHNEQLATAVEYPWMKKTLSTESSKNSILWLLELSSYFKPYDCRVERRSQTSETGWMRQKEGWWEKQVEEEATAGRTDECQDSSPRGQAEPVIRRQPQSWLRKKHLLLRPHNFIAHSWQYASSVPQHQAVHYGYGI